MALSASSRFPLTADLEICRLLNGMWQVSGAHGAIEPGRAVEDMLAYHGAGFTTWDLADHYGPAEDLVGAFRRRLAAARGADSLSEIQAFTKWVPYPGPMTRRAVEDAVDTSRRRMGVDRLDLLQFHWWDYADAGYLNALEHLADLREEGKIRHLGLTNFDTERLGLIAGRGVAIVSNQVQYSLIDRRPEIRMAPFCRDHRITLLAYGAVLGGLLSEQWLGRPEPHRAEFGTASLQKYKNMIDAWSGWPLFQELLAVLKNIADKHRVGIANVGMRYVLDRPAVAGVIVGARLGLAQHRAANARVFGWSLDDGDLALIETVLARSRDLMTVIGDCGDEYRR
ncbi:MAG TPA: aldo/keto reductase [Stellaceae bacterium]|jgi:aryl-alcohol dehydrogenase-like predicted oxidoreductase|nr:aldo/keto reductase [Stellaceae bacterium]